ncbi:MAG: formylmethanofuran dehydrogenase subunit B [Planctomycetaceae bacterium]|nr:formylmethanofuran dehydrogenase subunit B [Planctomycetaceae bacterium]
MTTDTIIDDVACTRCACVCDDLRLVVRDDRIVEAERACHLARDWYLAQNSIAPAAAFIQGRPAEYADAVNESARLLTEAKSPLIYGLSRSSTDGQRAAVRLADRLGATIDTTASEGHAPSLMALQQTGESTCSLGEIRHRADLVIFWGADPETTHPRHLERYSLWPQGEWTPNGRSDRTLVVVDSRTTRNQTRTHADLSIELQNGSDFEALWLLRAWLKGVDTGPFPEHLPVEQLRELLERMKSCRCGVIFFGYGLARQPAGHRVVEAVLQLTTDLNGVTRFHARRMRMLGDVAGADNVLCWQTGFPFAVNLSRGYPRYNPGEYSASDVLARGEADVVLFVGSDRIADFSSKAREELDRIPTILIDPPRTEPLWTGHPTVQFTTAIYGVHLPGTAYRMDDIPIPLRAALPTRYPSDADVLRAIQEKVLSTRY